jgi:hypothetical protein
MKTIRMTIDFTYDDQVMHKDDPEGIEWFKSILLGDNLHLSDFGDIGDVLGSVKVIAETEKKNE